MKLTGEEGLAHFLENGKLAGFGATDFMGRAAVLAELKNPMKGSGQFLPQANL